MKEFFAEGLKTETISSRALLILAEMGIGLSYALAIILGVMGAQRYAAPNLPIPVDFLRGLFLGCAIWASLTGLSFLPMDRDRTNPIKNRTALLWVLIPWITCTFIPLLYVFQSIGGEITSQWTQIIQTCLFSTLSFGLGGVVIGLTAILLQILFWRLLVSLKWGVILTCAMGFLLGLSAGWGAYGWTVLSSQVLFGLKFPF
jgi:hypothetical protein